MPLPRQRNFRLSQLALKNTQWKVMPVVLDQRTEQDETERWKQKDWRTWGSKLSVFQKLDFLKIFENKQINKKMNFEL